MDTKITIQNGNLEQPEIDAYLRRARKEYGRDPVALSIAVDGDFVELDYDFGHVPFQRIRRITGYLVGTLDRFNNAKRTEESERVKHGLL